MQSGYFDLLKGLVIQVSGKNTEGVIDILKDGNPINEFKIAEKLKLTINQARNILYKLYNQNIVSFVRKKDEKKGWYIYSWGLNVPKALERLKIIKEKEMDNMEHQLKSKENKRFYKCPESCIEVNEESAMLHHFTCPECGSILQLESTEELSKDLKSKIENSKKDISEIDEELRKLNEVRLVQIEKERIAKRKKAKRLRNKLKKAKQPQKKIKKKAKKAGKKAKKAKKPKKKIKIKKKIKRAKKR